MLNRKITKFHMNPACSSWGHSLSGSAHSAAQATWDHQPPNSPLSRNARAICYTVDLGFEVWICYTMDIVGHFNGHPFSPLSCNTWFCMNHSNWSLSECWVLYETMLSYCKHIHLYIRCLTCSYVWLQTNTCLYELIDVVIVCVGKNIRLYMRCVTVS